MFGKQLVSLLSILLITVFNSYICYKFIEKECSDLPSVGRREWGARLPRQSLAPSQLPVPHLFIYHTSSYSRQCLDLNSCIRAVRYIQDYQMDTQELRDISYNALIGGDGRIYWGRSTLVVGSQPVGLHDKSLSVAFIGQYDNQEPSQLMLDTAKRLVQCFEKLGDRLTGDYQLHGHRDQLCTKSPGQLVYNVIRQWPHFKGGPLSTYRCNKTIGTQIADGLIGNYDYRPIVGSFDSNGNSIPVQGSTMEARLDGPTSAKLAQGFGPTGYSMDAVPGEPANAGAPVATGAAAAAAATGAHLRVVLGGK
ncbi:peptidoglycan-recognition protein SD-like [Oppia nitens]|uniref:peptidoglycan-recognition protein SD-like n=1 Tax=Oppia nitens TaxID=1686743 RepID=UPI0023DA04B9|nr:peptidoglycan-recognition protein SD-like [Oppia nitens]